MDMFIAGFASVFVVSLAALILAQDPGRRYVQLFTMMSAMTVGWVVANYITNHSLDNLALVNFANKAAFLFGAGSVIFGLLFTYYFPVRRKTSKLEKLIITGLIVLLAVGSLSDVVVGTAVNRDGLLDFVSGEWIWCYVIGFMAIVAMIVRNLMKPKVLHTPSQSRQAKLITAAFIISSVVGLLLNAVLPALLSDWESTRYGPMVVVVLVGVIAYAVVKHGLFDIKLAAVRTIAYTMTLSTLSLGYYMMAFVVSTAISYVTNDGGADLINPMSIVLALVLAYVFQPIKAFFDHATNRVFFRASYDPEVFTDTLGKIFTSTVMLDELLERAAEEIATTLKASHVTFVVRDSSNNHTTVQSSGSYRRLSEETHERLRQHVTVADEAVISVQEMIDDTYSYTDLGQLYRTLLSKNVVLVLPLHGKFGYMLIGEQKAKGYTRRDIRALNALISELSIAVQNALSIQELQELNATLQQRIDNATRELRRTNLKLRQIDATKDEFINMASHQLRTPLTSIKGYLSMVLEGDVGDITKSQRTMLAEAFTSSERMVHLIGDFLNVSRLQTGKFMLDVESSDVAQMVADEVELMQRLANSHGIDLEFRKPRVSPMLYVDEDKLRQVVMNFIDNAIYYSPEHSTVRVKFEKRDGNLCLEVQDEGMGVPKDVQNRLFTKFFRADNARKQRPDGTGIGLYLAKKVVTEHGGDIIFRTRKGKGSVFGFCLPIAKLSKKPESND